MKLHKFTILPLLFITLTVNAQDCSCLTNLDFVIDKVERNYSGFADKVTDETESEYTNLVADLRLSAAKADPDQCYEILMSYRSFFYDDHFWIYRTAAFPVPQDTTTYSVPSVSIQLDEFRSKIESSVCAHPLEGIWVTDNYKVGIQKNESKSDVFEAFIIESSNANWAPFEIKMNLTSHSKDQIEVEYFMGDKSPQDAEGKLIKNIIDMGWLGIWKKTFPMSQDTVDIKSYEKLNQPFAPSITFRDSSTSIIKIPSFAIENKPMLDSLLNIHHDRLIKTPMMIIDIQNNGGGWNRTYEEVMKYIYSGPILLSGHSFYATTENIEKQREIYQNNIQFMSEEDHEEWSNAFESYEEHINTMAHYNGDTITMDSILQYPKKVALLINQRVGSSGEHFVLAAQQSSKVITFGQPTAGVVDYGDVRPHNFPCDYYGMNIPTTRFDWVDTHPLDATGIQPQVVMPEETRDFIDFVNGYFARESTTLRADKTE